MNIASWLKSSVKKLSNGNGTAELDSEVLLASILGVDRSWLHAHTESEIPEDRLDSLNTFLNRRAKHEPIAYILEKAEFYGREFYITNGVLVPRPESETMIDMLKKYTASSDINKCQIVDVGTGSGALIITAALETNIKSLTAIDIDDNCLEVARRNANSYELGIEFVQGDLLHPMMSSAGSVNLIILANLPYVPDRYTINSGAMNEPSHAIFGGEDGLDLYRRMFAQLRDLSHETVTVFTESLPFQHNDLAKIAQKYNLKQISSEDFIQVFSS